MPFQRLIKVLQKLYPIKYSETAWDNTGLLVDSSSLLTLKDKSPLKVLLTVDLTKKVVDEAISKNVKLIVAYHPFIFKGIKKIEPTANPQHASLIKLVSNGISVYSPHTAVDAIKGGVNDWLVEGIESNPRNIEQVQVISPNKENEEVGCGRILKLKEPKSVKEIIKRVKLHLDMENLLVANPHDVYDEIKRIKTIAICAGSGGSVFSSIQSQECVDLFFTGEMSHHEALMWKELGKVVICANHSNTERGYLNRMAGELQYMFCLESNPALGPNGRVSSVDINNSDVEVVVSAADKDPFEFM